MHSACFVVVLVLISNVSADQSIIFKWNICPSVTKNSLPKSCSSFTKTFNTSSELVDHFAEIFLKIFRRRGSIDDVFVTSIPVPAMSQLIFDVMKTDGKTVGISNPEDGAKLVSEAVTDTFGKFTPELYAEFMGRVAGQYLLSEGVLNEQNMETFADMFVQSLLIAFEEKPATFLHGLLNGVKRFFTPMGLYTSDKWDTLHSHCIYTAYKITGMV